MPFNGSTTLSFPDQSIANSAVNPYTVTVSEAGYQTFTRSGIMLNAFGPNTVMVSLVQQGWVVGTVTGTINATSSPLGQATVTATDVTGGATCASPPAATTAADGTYTLVGDPSTANGGLCVGHTYSVKVTPPSGFAVSTTSVTIVAGPNTDNVAVASTKLTVTVVVTGSDPAVKLAGVTVTGSSSVGGPVTATVGTYDPATNSITFSIPIDPTPYSFTISAPGYTTVTVGPVPFSPGVPPQTINQTLTLQKITISGTITTPSSTTPVGVRNAVVRLFVVNPDNTQTLAADTTTAANGTYSITTLNDLVPAGIYVPAGNYILYVTSPGYTPANTGVFTATYPLTVQSLQIKPNSVPVSVTVTSPSGVDLTGGSVTLTPEAKPTPAPACPAGTQPLDGLGLGSTTSGTINGGIASITQVVPDYYSLLVAKSGLPTQQPMDIAVCPSATAETVTVAFQSGQLNGVVNVPSGVTATQVLVVVHTGGAGGPAISPDPIIACANSLCVQGTYSLPVPLGSTYTAVATLTGYTAPNATSPVLTVAAPTATLTSTLTPMPHTVQVTVTDTSGALPLPNATVTIAAGGGLTGTTNASGVATIANVPASSTGAYTVTATRDAVTATGSVQVPISSTASDPIAATASAAYGHLTGTVTLSPAPATAHVVSIALNCTGGGCTSNPTTTVDVPAGSATGAIDYYLPAGTYSAAYTSPNFTQATAAIVVVTGTAADGSRTLTAATDTVTIAVTAAGGGAAIPGATLTVTVGGNAVTFPNTDAAGNSTAVIPLPDGPATLNASAKKGALTGSVSKSISAGTETISLTVS